MSPLTGDIDGISSFIMRYRQRFLPITFYRFDDISRHVALRGPFLLLVFTPLPILHIVEAVKCRRLHYIFIS